MANVCESCKTLERHQYWNEVPSEKQKFFKMMLGNFEHQLRIPRKFIECFRGDLSRSCTLRGQSGHVWRVEIVNTEEDVLFSDGWGNFVRDNGLMMGYFLVFCYAGDSSFEVSVFDTTGCEIEGSHFATNMNLSSRTCRSLLHSENGQSKGKSKVDEMTESKDGKERASTQEGFTSPKLYKKRGSSQGAQSQKFYKSQRRKVTEKEKQCASNRAIKYKKHKSRRENMIQIIMLPTHVYLGFHLTIPKEWAVEHMLPESHEGILRVPRVEKSWKVGCRWTPSQCQIIRGWSTFVLDNNLEEHDVCVFELVQKGDSRSKRNPIFHVHIFRVVREVVPLIVSRRRV